MVLLWDQVSVMRKWGAGMKRLKTSSTQNFHATALCVQGHFVVRLVAGHLEFCVREERLSQCECPPALLYTQIC